MQNLAGLQSQTQMTLIKYAKWALMGIGKKGNWYSERGATCPLHAKKNMQSTIIPQIGCNFI